METLTNSPMKEQNIFIFGFVQGDTVGTILNAQPSETICNIMNKFLEASEIRTGNSGQYQVRCKNILISPDARIQDTSIKSFERIDIIKTEDLNTKLRN